MFSKLERKIAFRYLATKKRGFGSVISWVSLIGITLGVATLIVVMSVMGGFHDTLLSRIVGMNGHVVVYHQDKPRAVGAAEHFIIGKGCPEKVCDHYQN